MRELQLYTYANCTTCRRAVKWLRAHGPSFAEVSLRIVGWVAMWRPLEIYLYDWWPIQGDQPLFERLARIRVRQILPPA